MSANINVTAKGYSFAALEDVAVWWSPEKKHNLMTADSTPAEWMETSGQGYEVKSAPLDRKSTRLNSSHSQQSRMPSSA